MQHVLQFANSSMWYTKCENIQRQTTAVVISFVNPHNIITYIFKPCRSSFHSSNLKPYFIKLRHDHAVKIDVFDAL